MMESTTPGIVLFLGAGASKVFGYPLTNEIFAEIWNRANSSRLFPQDSAEAPELVGLMTHVLPGIKESGSSSIINRISITDVLSFVDYLLLSGDAAVPRIHTPQLERLRKLLEKAIVAVVSPRTDEIDEKGRTLVEPLVEWIASKANQRSPFTIISTNYDMSVETRLVNQIAKSRPDIAEAIDFGFSWREADTGDPERINHRPSKPIIRILKLHGSVGWLRCSLCGFTYVDPASPIVDFAFDKFAEDYNRCSCDHFPLRPVIVAPSLIRSYGDADLQSIAKAALEALRTSPEWLIVGYSLPPEDLEIRSILNRAYNGRGTTSSPPNIQVVQRNDSLQERYRLAFPRCLYDGGGFESFIYKLSEYSAEVEKRTVSRSTPPHA